MNQLLSFWTLDWLSLLVVVGLALLYGFVANWRLKPGAGLYGSGLLVIGLVQTSPLHVLGAHYLLSAHMIGHILLMLVGAPLLVLGLPQQPMGKGAGLIQHLSLFFQKWPWLGWLAGLGVMWFWHIPSVYDATVAHDYSTALGDIAAIPLCQVAGASAGPLTNLAHILHPVSLLLAGICFAWPVLGPQKQHRLHPLTGVLYLFTACTGCSLLGLMITFAPMGVYQTYTGADYYGLVSLIRYEWGLDRATDQQMAGLLMWVPGCLIYLTGVVYLLTHWLTSTASTVTSAPVRLVWEGDKQ